mmetsp:Transcript_130641/g.406210  ORF Transcript_130641/g.406210 Transcript_130641/m.406210 type:complete len:420 (-) Transcript_130641:145-1404(-)
MSHAVLPSVSPSASRLGDSKLRSKSSTAKFQPTSQARFGYLGHLSLRDSQDNSEALRNVAALDGTSFLPNVMTLQRPSTPWQFKTPLRVPEDQVAVEGAQSSEDSQSSPALASGKVKPGSKNAVAAAQPLPTNYVRRIRRRAQSSSNDPSDHRQQMADLKLLADSASRSGNVYQALQAYHKMGVVLDNQGMLAEATQKYKQFLSLCIASKNIQGEALAYNCLGIDTFKMGQYDESIQYHNRHLELADSTGRLIAHTNLGIVFQAMGLSEHAAIHHQHAIEYANRMGAKDAQCFTVGNLGIASAAQGDLQTSRICLQYHLNSAQRQKHLLGDTKFASQTLKSVSNNAYHRLGQVSASDGRLDEAASHFAKAMDVAKSKGDQQNEEKSGAMLGIARGLSNFDQHVESLMRAAKEPSPDVSG